MAFAWPSSWEENETRGRAVEDREEEEQKQEEAKMPTYNELAIILTRP